MKNAILLRNGLVEVSDEKSANPASDRLVATVISNLTYFGYIVSKDAYSRLCGLSTEDIKSWWSTLEPILKDITGESKNMAKYVVYKNFPEEVLNKSDAEYWIAQILMYWGVPNDYFTEDEQDREYMLENVTLKVLHLSNINSSRKILDSLLKNPARWTQEQIGDVQHLVINEALPIDIPSIVFKENMASIVSKLVESDIDISMKSATDVLRIAVGMSDGDVSMRTPSRFRKFSRKERRFFLKMLENSTSLQEDMARDKNKWKKFMRALRPNDYRKRFPHVSICYNCLYKGHLSTFNSKVETMYGDADERVLNVVSQRPGEFVRRLHSLVDVFGVEAVKRFIKILPKLSVIQLLKIGKYVENINSHKYRVFPPRGNWTKLQVVDNKRKFPKALRSKLLEEIRLEKGRRIRKMFPTINLSDSAKMVKLQTSDSELTNYGRGTVFPIPENIKFIRSASYWQTSGTYDNIWYDNSWNFFNDEWKSLAACCWDSPQALNKGAVFSGDPTNSKELDGKACQMIDIYLDKLEEAGARYAVWNVLCYSQKTFNEADEVYAAMQWGEEPQKGKLFEPSRCQLSFPLTGDSMTKYIVYVDIKERKVIYLDANMYASVYSATQNGEQLETKMPAFIEYMENIPSVHDLFDGIRTSKNGLPVSYGDDDLSLKGGPAYIFKPTNEDNSFEQVDLSKLLG